LAAWKRTPVVGIYSRGGTAVLAIAIAVLLYSYSSSRRKLLKAQHQQKKFNQ
jgi:hypothetical protein